ncbi:hypothetical protein, partial [Solidesulfovibrio sp.]|uniref:hypothetical protein n=1 Tax=Solidesulfovibrio sp. TaxID=2910990 RepID=UPI002633FE86
MDGAFVSPGLLASPAEDNVKKKAPGSPPGPFSLTFPRRLILSHRFGLVHLKLYALDIAHIDRMQRLYFPRRAKIATFITRFELAASRMEDHYPEIEQICNEIAQLIMPLHRTMVDGVERD